MPATSLQDLYTQKLQLLLDAEQQGLSAMPQLVQQVQNEQLRTALQQHHRQTEQQVERLQQLIGNRQGGQSMQNSECISMRALIQEAQTLLPNIQDPDTIDAFIIGAQQAVEHHEIAAYGTARRAPDTSASASNRTCCRAGASGWRPRASRSRRRSIGLAAVRRSTFATRRATVSSSRPRGYGVCRADCGRRAPRRAARLSSARWHAVFGDVCGMDRDAEPCRCD